MSEFDYIRDVIDGINPYPEGQVNLEAKRQEENKQIKKECLLFTSLVLLAVATCFVAIGYALVHLAEISYRKSFNAINFNRDVANNCVFVLRVGIVNCTILSGLLIERSDVGTMRRYCAEYAPDKPAACVNHFMFSGEQQDWSPLTNMGDYRTGQVFLTIVVPIIIVGAFIPMIILARKITTTEPC